MDISRSIAVAQTCPVRGDVGANIDEHLRLLGIAADEGAQVVVFPELSLTGYELDLARDLAFDEADGRLKPLIDASVSRSITAIVGAPVRIGAQLCIGAFILRPDGTNDVYTKHHLGAFSASAARDGVVPAAEATVFEPGDRNPIVTFGGYSGAVAVCADVGQPAHAQRAAERGATAYFASMFVIPSEFDGDAAKLRGYAAEYGFVVALANFGCATGGLAAAGRSSIWSETGERLTQLDTGGAGVAIARETAEGWRTRTVIPASR